MLLARKSNRPNPIVPPARPRKQRITRRQKAQTNRMCREPSGGGGGHMLPMSSSGIPWRGWQPTGATTWLQCVDTNSIVLTKHSNAIHARLNMIPRHIFAQRNHARESVCVPNWQSAACLDKHLLLFILAPRGQFTSCDFPTNPLL